MVLKEIPAANGHLLIGHRAIARCQDFWIVAARRRIRFRSGHLETDLKHVQHMWLRDENNTYKPKILNIPFCFLDFHVSHYFSSH